MIDSIQEITIKSDGISEPGRKSVTGPSCEVSQHDPGSSMAEYAGQEVKSELEWAKLQVKEEPEPRLVERKTALHCGEPVLHRKRKSAVREQQDRTKEKLLTRLNKLECQVKNLEHEWEKKIQSRAPALQEEIA